MDIQKAKQFIISSARPLDEGIYLAGCPSAYIISLKPWARAHSAILSRVWPISTKYFTLPANSSIQALGDVCKL